MFGIHSSSSTNIIYVTCILVKLSTSKLCIRLKPFGSNSYKAVQLLTCELAFSCICPHVLHSIMLKTLNLKMLHVLILQECNSINHCREAYSSPGFDQNNYQECSTQSALYSRLKKILDSQISAENVVKSVSSFKLSRLLSACALQLAGLNLSQCFFIN